MATRPPQYRKLSPESSDHGASSKRADRTFQLALPGSHLNLSCDVPLKASIVQARGHIEWRLIFKHGSYRLHHVSNAQGLELRSHVLKVILVQLKTLHLLHLHHQSQSHRCCTCIQLHFVGLAVGRVCVAVKLVPLQVLDMLSDPKSHA